MSIRHLGFYSLSIALCFTNIAFGGGNLNMTLYDEMEKLGVDTAVIIGSPAIDDYPIWSKNSKFVAVNVMGEWIKFNLAIAALEPAGWLDKKIGINTNQDAYSVLTPEESYAFDAMIEDAGRKIKTKHGFVVELQKTGLGTKLVFMHPTQVPVTIWKTAMESCFGLVLSPDEKYVAYLCASNGLFVTRLP